MSSTPVLPQRDPNPEARARTLKSARARYVYDSTILPPLPMAHEVPEEDQPSTPWIARAGMSVGRVGLNLLANKAVWAAGGGPLFFGGDDPDEIPLAEQQAAEEAFLREVEALEADEAEAQEGPLSFGLLDNPLIQDVADRVFKVLGAKYIDPNAKFDPWVSPATPNGRPTCTQDYTDLFRAIGATKQVETYQTDAAFCRTRLAGQNGRQIHRVTELPDNFPVQEEHFAVGATPGDTLARALDEGRVFLCDYAPLAEGLEPNLAPDGAQKYISGPLALFAVPPGGGALRAVAIQCVQDPDPEAAPVFTPADGWRWRMARYVVECADQNIHEIVSHLAMTHLRTEALVMATNRELARNHPLCLLLKPHFEGTLFINRAAAISMLAINGSVDRVFAGTIESTIGMAAEALLIPNYLDRMLPRDLVLRGVDDPTVIRDYPYRDDALRLWNAIRGWVSEYVGIYYPSEADFTEDTELAAWVAVLRRPVTEGGVAGFGDIDSRESLIENLTYIINTVSAEHAAVNFPQLTDMAYAPASSGSFWAPPPTASTVDSEQSFLDFLPPLQLGELQLELHTLLGSTYFTQLGDYKVNRWPYGDALKDPAVAEALERFRARLREVEAEINAVNADPALRSTPYEHLLPSRVPQSINI